MKREQIETFLKNPENYCFDGANPLSVGANVATSEFADEELKSVTVVGHRMFTIQLPNGNQIEQPMLFRVSLEDDNNGGIRLTCDDIITLRKP